MNPSSASAASRQYDEELQAPVPQRAPGLLSRNRDWLWGLLNALQSSALLPLRWRHRLLRKAGCALHETAEVREGVFVGSRQLTMERGTYVNVGCLLDGSAPITLREYVRMGPRVTVLTGTHTYQHEERRRGPRSRDLRLPVEVGRGCWIGTGAILMPGVVVAPGCIVAAGAVVLRSTEPNGLYAGNPAVRVKDLPTHGSSG